eukprot:scaffold24_cov245-Pinguiococcus_pyrenoidosus.AAC.20
MKQRHGMAKYEAEGQIQVYTRHAVSGLSRAGARRGCDCEIRGLVGKLLVYGVLGSPARFSSVKGPRSPWQPRINASPTRLSRFHTSRRGVAVYAAVFSRRAHDRTSKRLSAALLQHLAQPSSQTK